MKLQKTNYSIRKVIIANLFFILALVSTNAIMANPVKSSGKPRGIIGVWQLKRTITEKKSRPSNAFLPVNETPESLILAVEEGIDEITINEGFKEFIQTQTLPTDGQMVTKSFQKMGRVSSKATWINGRLVVEIVTSRGDKLVETFELSAKQNLLNVSLQFTEARSAKTMKIRRIYQRVGDLDENNSAQVGITVYPF